MSVELGQNVFCVPCGVGVEDVTGVDVVSAGFSVSVGVFVGVSVGVSVGIPFAHVQSNGHSEFILHGIKQESPIKQSSRVSHGIGGRNSQDHADGHSSSALHKMGDCACTSYTVTTTHNKINNTRCIN